MFSCEFWKFKKQFFIEHLVWLLLQKERLGSLMTPQIEQNARNVIIFFILTAMWEKLSSYILSSYQSILILSSDTHIFGFYEIRFRHFCESAE